MVQVVQRIIKDNNILTNLARVLFVVLLQASKKKKKTNHNNFYELTTFESLSLDLEFCREVGL